MNLIEQLNELKQGDLLTIVNSAAFGVNVTHCKFESFKTGRYAQYDTSISFYFKTKGKRKIEGFRMTIGDGTQFLIFKGHVELNKTSGFDKTEFGSSSRYACFDSRYWSDFMSALTVKPWLSVNIKDVKQWTDADCIYKVFSDVDGDTGEYTINELIEKFQVNGVCTSKSVRPELQNRPTLKRLCGPMYDGETDAGQPIIRYECAETNRVLSL